MNRLLVLLATATEAANRLTESLRGARCETILTSGLQDFTRSIQTHPIDLAIVQGQQALQAIRIAREHALPAIFLASDNSDDELVSVFRAGAADYLKSPQSARELTESVERCLAGRDQDAEPLPPGTAGFGKMVGVSGPILRIKQRIARIAAADCNVLITGETGTGKEVVAELIHRNSARRKRPFVCINCAAIPDTLFESELFGHERGAFTGASARHDGKLKQANRGTVFLDEIGDLSLYAQAKLLRTIEVRQVESLGGSGATPVDIRLIAATNRDLDAMTKQGLFRRDLYFRLNVARVHLPPLRDRRTDIPLLLDYFVGEFNRRFRTDVAGFREDVRALLLRYDWPGNVRELRNLLESVYVNQPAREVSLDDLPEQFRDSFCDTAFDGDADRLLSALLATNWNKSRAAEKLKWSRMKVYRTLARYNLPARKEPGNERRAPGSAASSSSSL